MAVNTRRHSYYIAEHTWSIPHKVNLFTREGQRLAAVAADGWGTVVSAHVGIKARGVGRWLDGWVRSPIADNLPVGTKKC